MLVELKRMWKDAVVPYLKVFGVRLTGNVWPRFEPDHLHNTGQKPFIEPEESD
jgi:hypothetical protein